MATVHGLKDHFLDWLWRPENRSPDSSRLTKALVCSLGIHFFLILFSGSIGHSGSTESLPKGIHSAGMSGLPSTAPAFLIVHLAEERRPTPPDHPDNQPALPAPEEPRVKVSLSAKPATSGTNQSTEVSASGVEVDGGKVGRSPTSNSASEDAALLARRAEYALANLLDVSPYPLVDIKPEYPDTAGNQQGRVVLRLFINENGDVDELVVVRATPRGFFEEAAVSAFAKGRFSPGMKTGRAVKSQLAVEVEFVPFNRGAGVSGHSY